jgi:tetratricopeptide (TPR) repeat protein
LTARSDRPGDALLLAREAADAQQKVSLLVRAAQLLHQRGHDEFALAQVEQALSTDPKNLAGRQQKGALLAALEKFAAARDWAENIVNDHPKDAPSWALLGEVEEAEWISRWRRPGADPARMRERAEQELHLLVQAIEPFHAAISLDPADFASGVNALRLRYLLLHLSGADHHPVSAQRLREAVRSAASSASKKNPANDAALSALAELSLLQGETVAADRYRAAFAHANPSLLQSIQDNLSLLADLQFRSEQVQDVLAMVDQEIARRPLRTQPEKVFLFSGHMIDRPDRNVARFPPSCEGAADAEISRMLDQLNASASDLAICSGACGGDLIFIENCLKRGLSLRLHLPFSEAQFLGTSVAFAGEQWVARYNEARRNPLTKLLIMSEELGTLPQGADPYSRTNVWELYTALCEGPERVRFIALWNGETGDGPGGTRHMVESVEKHAGQAYILDTKKLCRG